MKIINEMQAANMRARIRALPEADFQAVKQYLVTVFADVATQVGSHDPRTSTHDNLLLRAGMIASVEHVSTMLDLIRKTSDEHIDELRSNAAEGGGQ